MNQALLKTALFLRDLLPHPESLIKLGRLGENIEDFETNYIGVDSLGAAMRMATGETYDGTAEVMNHAQQWQAPVTVNFYGANAWDNASRFSLLIPSQKAYELQRSLGVAVYQVSQITDVKILAGQQYGNRYEVTLNVQYSIGVDVDTLRIDTAQLELRTETGEETLP